MATKVKKEVEKTEEEKAREKMLSEDWRRIMEVAILPMCSIVRRGEEEKRRKEERKANAEQMKVEAELNAIRDEYAYDQRGFLLKRFGDKVQLATRPLYAQDVLRLLQPVQQQSLSQAAMETLAVVAYKQPVTRAEVEQVRGVKCDYSLQSLINKGLIKETGRKDTIGRPILFATTDEFLSHFGLEGLDGLPPMPEPEEAHPPDETDEIGV